MNPSDVRTTAGLGEPKAEPNAAGRGHTAGRRRRRFVYLVVPVTLASMVGLGVSPQVSAAREQASHAITSSVSRLDAKTDSTGQIVVDAKGNGYVAWNHLSTTSKPDAVYFCVIPAGGTCKHPISLPIPEGDQWGVTEPFPVLGAAANVVYVVGPRYVPNDTVIWTSKNGGASFSTGYVLANSYGGGTTVSDVLRIPPQGTSFDFFDEASDGPYLGFSFSSTSITKCITCQFNFGAGGTVAATLGLIGNGAVEAYYTDAHTPTVDYYWSKYDDIPAAGAWTGPIKVGDGDNARLAGGPKGLFLLSQATVHGKLQLQVRKWDTSTHLFGKATVVATDTTSTGSETVGGFAEDDHTGALYVAWEGSNSKGDYMRLWVSTNSGASWSAAADVAPMAFAYVGPTRMAAVKGSGFLTFQDSQGLYLVDLAHL